MRSAESELVVIPALLRKLVLRESLTRPAPLGSEPS